MVHAVAQKLLAAFWCILMGQWMASEGWHPERERFVSIHSSLYDPHRQSALSTRCNRSHHEAPEQQPRLVLGHAKPLSFSFNAETAHQVEHPHPLDALRIQNSRTTLSIPLTMGDKARIHLSPGVREAADQIFREQMELDCECEMDERRRWQESR